MQHTLDCQPNSKELHHLAAHRGWLSVTQGPSQECLKRVPRGKITRGHVGSAKKVCKKPLLGLYLCAWAASIIISISNTPRPWAAKMVCFIIILVAKSKAMGSHADSLMWASADDSVKCSSLLPTHVPTTCLEVAHITFLHCTYPMHIMFRTACASFLSGLKRHHNNFSNSFKNKMLSCLSASLSIVLVYVMTQCAEFRNVVLLLMLEQSKARPGLNSKGQHHGRQPNSLQQTTELGSYSLLGCLLLLACACPAMCQCRSRRKPNPQRTPCCRSLGR